ncbi:tetratricopeptide repeat protein [Algicella marina]|uniref:Tetratricopeptide repeat protein n=1 Tax=Algicella marina TaxID=2683284 RepID=A0A6P1T8S6_9RHOB|nr:tetratricopeptide repeat protein [Algicella marina]QHQ37022.1 tetratricopeptide repeat protein [Algicella marina]
MAACVAATLTLGVGTASAQGLAGPYLAATQADFRNDYEAAADFYSRILLHDPQNRAILQNALVAHIAAGRFDGAESVAARLLSAEPSNQVAGLMKLTIAIREGATGTAEAILRNPEFRFNELFSGLLLGWVAVSEGNFAKATEAFEALQANETLVVYGTYHKALATALAGDYATAAALMESDPEGPLHVDRAAVIAHIAMLSQSDQQDKALAIADMALSDGYVDKEITAIREKLAAGEKVPFTLVETGEDGASLVFGLLASALARDDADRFALVYSRLANHIDPAYEESLILTAEVLSAQGQYDMAIATYKAIAPNSPWYITAEVGRADALRDSDRADLAIEVLSKLAREEPDELTVITALGDLQRTSENFEAAAEAYTTAINLLEDIAPSHWVVFYSRGISFERSGEWDKAEADFRKALELQPDQPLVLNYLGYSLVELPRDLEEAQAMIEKAVEQRPDDGYITDSLGWVLYRVGKFEEAVPHMERAVELEPVDPIINDHLGDVLWKVGRKLEAEFQWRRALSFDPEDKDAERIRRKLEVGLDRVLEDEAAEGASGPGNTAQDL